MGHGGTVAIRGQGVKNCSGPARLASNPAAAPARPGVGVGGGAATRGGPAQLSPGRDRRGPAG